MKYAPSPKNKKPDVAVITLLITSVVLFFLASQSYTKGRALVQGLGVLCLALAAFFIIKRLTAYVYTVYGGAATEGDSSAIDPSHLTLLISKKTGSSSEVNQAEFPLSTLKDVIALPPPSSKRRRMIKELGDRVLGFAYKPFDPIKLSAFFAQIEERKMDVLLKTFAPFDLFIDGEAVDFTSAKSKELLALLTVFNGSTLTLEQAIAKLWPNHDVELSKRLYRDAKIRLKSVLEESGLGELVSFGYGYLRINKEYARCDYWDFLLDKTKPYSGTFLPGYEWAKEYKYPMDLKLAGMR